MALFLTEEEVGELLPANEAVEAVERAMKEAASGEAFNEPRRRLRLSRGMLHTMAAAQPQQGFFALKAYTAFGGKIRFRVLLYDAQNGDIVAFMEGDRMGQIRTGAASAVAAKYMADPSADEMGLFGSGFQAEGQIEAIAAVRPLKTVKVYARNQDRLADFCKRMSEKTGIDVVPVATAVEATRDLPIVTTATTSKEPVMTGKDLADGAFLNAVGANLRIKREIDGAAIRRASPLIVDTKIQAELESGALLQTMEAGHLHWEQVHELADVIGGRVSGRPASSGVALFHSLGMALWDSAVAIHVYKKAQAAGRGTELPFN